MLFAKLTMLGVIALILLTAACSSAAASTPANGQNTPVGPSATTQLPSLTSTSLPASAIAPALPFSKEASLDFDSGLPVLIKGQNTPFDQTTGGVTAHFSSPSDPAAFSIQNGESTFLKLDQFSGNYLYQNNLVKTKLVVKFSRPVTSINLTFCTVDSHGVGEVNTPGDIRLTAFSDSAGTVTIGAATGRGTISSNTYPQGILAFDSNGQAFVQVVIDLPDLTGSTTSFMIDNLKIVSAP